MGEAITNENGLDNSIQNFPLDAATEYGTFPNLPDVLEEDNFIISNNRASLFLSIHLAIRTLNIEDTDNLFEWVGSLSYQNESVRSAAKDISLKSIRESINTKLFEIYPLVKKINLKEQSDESLAQLFTSIAIANDLDIRDIVDLGIEIFGDKLKSAQKTEPLKKSDSKNPSKHAPK